MTISDNAVIPACGPCRAPFGTIQSLRTGPGWVCPLAVTLVLVLGACGNGPTTRAAFGQRTDAAAAVGPARLVACKLMPLAEMSALAGQSYTTAEPADDSTQTSSECHYHSGANPIGASLTLQWISPRDYSDPAEHAALQKASVAGAHLAGKLTESIPGQGAMRNGPVMGVGDEAYVSMGLLTARKGDVSIMVQIGPADMVAFVKDTAVSGALIESEKAVALKIISRL